MDEYENMCKVITSGYCPYADGVDEDVKSCADCTWNNPEAEQKFFEEVKHDQETIESLQHTISELTKSITE